MFTIKSMDFNLLGTNPKIKVTPVNRDGTVLTTYETEYDLIFVDPCPSATITPSMLGPLFYDLDGSGTVQATFPEFGVTPSYCIKGY